MTVDVMSHDTCPTVSAIHYKLLSTKPYSGSRFLCIDHFDVLVDSPVNQWFNLINFNKFQFATGRFYCNFDLGS